ncbi:MAG: D-alanyl-D-alanine carboxypeptidase [Cohaesibacter sp.]|jgi:D-alanyl-D-alanine carboxypeptidase (penicillin-binding protein 5/6)|nr:D-alanyl-D-alanine carboxypeptidase [Cohaesibacter sp.]
MHFSKFYMTFAKVILLIAMLGLPSVAQAQIFQTKAKHALLIDWDSGSVLFAKDEKATFPPASLAKLMTLEVVFNAIAQGELTLDDEFLISENAWRTGGGSSGGSTMFAKLDSSIRLQDLLMGIIVQSGNDACIAIAEGMAGNEESFAQLMNNRAKLIGLKDSYFVNSTGLPAEGQFVSAQDLALLAKHLIKTYPEFYEYFSVPEFKWNGITQRNRNPLLGQTAGADGLKTGYTKASGYGVVASVLRNDQRLLLVLSGLKSKKERSIESRKIVDWGFRAFVSERIYETDEEIAFASVYGGDQSKVMLVSDKPVSLFMPRSKRGSLKARVVYQGPIKAPIAEGDEIATLKVWSDKKLIMETPLVAAHSVGTGTLTQRALDAVHHLLLGWL